MRLLSRSGLGCLLLLAACKTAPPVKEAFQYRQGLRPAAYFPLAAGAVWSYRATITGGAQDLLVVSKVASMDGTRAVISPDLSYEDRGESIVRLPSGTEILRTPIDKGA